MEKLRAFRESQNPALAALSHIQMVKGEKGDKGDTVVGPQGPVGPRGPAGKDGADGQSIVGPKGERGVAGRHGIDGTNGKDGSDGKDGISPSITAIIKELKKLPISLKDIKDAPDLTELPQLIKFLKAGGFRGGGDTVAAGAGLAVSVANGVKTFSTTGSSGTKVRDENASSLTLAHTPLANTLQLFRGGSRLSVVNGDFTIVGAVITLASVLQANETLTADYEF